MAGERETGRREYVNRRRAALLSCQWDVLPDESPTDAVLAGEQAEFLRGRYDAVENLREAVAFLSTASFRGFAHVEKHYGENGEDVVRLEPVEQWFWCREGMFGEWTYNREARSGVERGEVIERGNFAVVESPMALDRILSVQYFRRNMALRDWSSFLDVYGIPSVFFVGPPGVTEEKEQEYLAIAQELVKDGRGYSKGTINAMEHYGYLTPTQGAAARAFYGYGDTAIRSPGPSGGTLANTGWTDEARAAALAARRAKASGAGSTLSGGIRANGRYKTENGKTVFVPDPPPLLSPPREGTIINVGGWISIMMNGKPVRIGSTKVLCVLPDGQLGVKLGGKAYPIGKPSQWRTGMGGARFVAMGGKYYLDVGKGYLDLATGQLRVKPAQTVPRGGGTVKIEINRYNPFSGPGEEIPPDPPDISQRRYLQA